MQDFWKLQEDMLDGKAGGKIIWQPRIECWYEDRIFRDGTLPGKYSGMDYPGLYRELEVSFRAYPYRHCFRLVEAPEIKRSIQRLNAHEVEERIHTPIGTVNCILRGNDSNGGTYPIKWWVTCEEDLKIMTYVYAHQTWEWDEEMYQIQLEKWGRLGIPQVYMPRVNIQHMFHELMGIEETIFALCDYPEALKNFSRFMKKRMNSLLR